MAFTQVQVTGTYRDAEGNDAHGAVVFVPTHAMRNGEITVAAPRTAQIVAGSISIDLAATDDAGTTPEGVVYEVSEHITGTRVRRTYYLEIPADAGAVDLDTAPIAEDPPTAVTFPVPGPEGPAGPAGRTILNGTTTPASGLGAVGDFYINTTADTIYGPKTGSGWGNPTSLVGPQGPPGADGTGAVTSVNGQTGVVDLDAGDVGLGNVTNTTDLAKPVSTAQQAALDLKADLADVTPIVFLTQAEYDGLTPDPDTLYVVVID